MRSLEGNLRPRPRCIDWATARSIHQGQDLIFPRKAKQSKLISYLLYGLFFDWEIMDLSLACSKLKPVTGKKNITWWVVHLSLWYSHVTLVSRYLFDSCQLTVTWMSIRIISTIKLNTDCIWLEHIANAGSWKENLARLAASQSAHSIVAI